MSARKRNVTFGRQSSALTIHYNRHTRVRVHTYSLETVVSAVLCGDDYKKIFKNIEKTIAIGKWLLYTTEAVCLGMKR